MSTSVVILAQGDQKRLPDLRIPKQLIALPACGKTPILDRTLRMVYELAGIHPMVVGWPHFVDHYTIHPVKTSMGETVRPLVVTLDAPGNSSIKGLHQVFQKYKTRTDRVVVLLGDVVYQWSVLEELLAAGPGTPTRDCVFAVSHDLHAARPGATHDARAGNRGELWGGAWNQVANADVMSALNVAHAKQPYNTDVYQNGQMRLWLWELERSFVLPGAVRYVTDPAEGDYITDIDLPRHTESEFLIPLSERAAADDAAHGVTW